MIRKPAFFAALSSLMLLILLFWPTSRQMEGMLKVARDSNIQWFFAKDGLKLGEYEAGARYLDAVVISYHEGVDGDPYIEKNNWHLDEEGRRYKISFTSSFDCEGTELGT